MNHDISALLTRRGSGAALRSVHVAILAACAFTLTACSTNRTETAMQLIQHQQEQQSKLRQHEADVAKKHAPTEPEVVMAMIRESQDQQRYFASLAYIDAYTQQFGSNVELAALRANALRMTDQTTQSEAAYQALLKTNEAATGWHGLGLLAAANSNYTQAADHLAKAATLRPTNAEYLNDLGYARLQAGDINGARLPLGQAAELAPANNKILANLALLLLVQDQSAQAHAVMDRAGLSQQAQAQVQKLAADWHSRPTRAHTRDNTTKNAVTTTNTVIRPVVTPASIAPAQAVPPPAQGNTVGFHQAPLMQRSTPLAR